MQNSRNLEKKPEQIVKDIDFKFPKKIKPCATRNQTMCSFTTCSIKFTRCANIRFINSIKLPRFFFSYYTGNKIRFKVIARLSRMSLSPVKQGINGIIDFLKSLIRRKLRTSSHCISFCI